MKSRKRWSKQEEEYLEDKYEDMTDKELGKRLQRKTSAIESKRRKLGLKKTAQFSNESGFDLGYVLGVVKGDGSVYSNRITLETNSVEFAASFSLSLAKIMRRKPYPIWFNKKKGTNNVRGASKEFTEWYNSLELSELRKKLDKNRKMAEGFIKGFFDSEGSYSRKGELKMDNTNKNLLLMIKELLHNHFSISSSLFSYELSSQYVESGYTVWRLSLTKIREMDKFILSIGTSISEKDRRHRLFLDLDRMNLIEVIKEVRRLQNKYDLGIADVYRSSEVGRFDCRTYGLGIIKVGNYHVRFLKDRLNFDEVIKILEKSKAHSGYVYFSKKMRDQTLRISSQEGAPKPEYITTLKVLNNISFQEEKRRLREYEKGGTDKEIAQRIGISSGAFNSWRNNRGLPTKRVREGGAERQSSVEVECEICGKIIEKKVSVLKNQEHVFCSRECHGRWRSKKYSGKENPNWRD